jgi:hypothetical protein
MTEGTPGWLGRLAVTEGEIWICTRNDMTTTSDGWRRILTEIP